MNDPIVSSLQEERVAVEHELKTWPVYFDAVSFFGKDFEVRRDDRDFQTGDTVRLREWDEAKGYSGRQLKFRIGYVLRGFLPEHVVFALQPMATSDADPRRLIQEALDTAHHAGWFKEAWEGSIDASARIVRELGLESKVGDQ